METFIYTTHTVNFLKWYFRGTLRKYRGNSSKSKNYQNIFSTVFQEPKKSYSGLKILKF